MDQARRSGPPTAADAPAGERYLLLADISGYSGFMTGVELEHGVDFGAGIPAAYSVLGDLLDVWSSGSRSPGTAARGRQAGFQQLGRPLLESGRADRCAIYSDRRAPWMTPTWSISPS